MVDSKDWTWVLGRACPECGFDTREVEPAAVGGMVRELAGKWAGVLGGGDGVRVRPAAQVWSPLEYGCHVRDVFRIYDQRLGLMLTEDDPLFPNWDQDDTAVADRYGEQDPATVAGELQDAGTALAGTSTRSGTTSGTGPAAARTAPGSPSPPSPATSSTTRSITSGT